MTPPPIRLLALPDAADLDVYAHLFGPDGLPFAVVHCPESVSGSALYQGQMPANTPAGGYAVRFFTGVTYLGAGVVQWGGSEEVAAVPAPPGADRCTLFVDTASFGLGPVAGVRVSAVLSVLPAAGGGWVFDETPAWMETGADGHAEMQLVRNDAITPAGTTWILNCPRLHVRSRPVSLTTDFYNLEALA
jgi:hypothetical protein